MTNFKDLGIKATTQAFAGDKIKMKKILNTEITVNAFKLETSKFEGKGMCLYLQITFNGIQHVLFTGSSLLIEMIKQVPSDKFPFTTKIVEENERFMFT